MTARKEQTALGAARARFREGLPRKASELKGAVALLAATPQLERPREELRRRLHALYVSAQVFEEEGLAAAIQGGLMRLDRARDERRALVSEDLELLQKLTHALPSFSVAGPLRASATAAPAGAASMPPAASRREANTPLPAAVPVRSAWLPGSELSSPHARDGLPSPSGERRTHGAQVLGVLIAGPKKLVDEAVSALADARFEVMVAQAPDMAVRVARTCVPDVLLVDATWLSAEQSLGARLREVCGDALLLAAVGAAGTGRVSDALPADGTLMRPVTASALLSKVTGDAARLPGLDDGLASDRGLLALSDATVADVAECVADEIRRGITGALQRGGDVRLPLGDAAELRAVAFSAISRIRAHLSQRSHGQVQFRDATQGGPALIAMTDGEGDLDAASVDATLDGRSILVVDDDPGVRWFFSRLLQEAGANVIEAIDGRQALELARKHHPDVVISDILMPRLDGFGLCRELRRDVRLSHTPVLLLSWKEELLQRTRELQPGASGYLRKEAGSAQVLAQVHAVLRSRARLETQLAQNGEVRGRLERVGLEPLLTTVARKRPNAQVGVRDAYNLFEIELRNGQLVGLTRTGIDGGFARGPAALPQLVAVTSGRYVVVEETVALRDQFRAPLLRVLRDAAERMSAMLAALSMPRLGDAARIQFDENLLPDLMRGMAEPMRRWVERLRSGERPVAILQEGEQTAQQLERQLELLARREAVSGVRGPRGEDRVAEALAARRAQLVQSLATRPVAEDAAPVPVEATRAVAAAQAVPIIESPTAEPSPPDGAPAAVQQPSAVAVASASRVAEPSRRLKDRDARRGWGLAIRLAACGLMGFAGYYGVRWHLQESAGEMSSPITVSPLPAHAAAEDVLPVDPPSSLPAEATADLDAADPEALDALQEEVTFGRILPFIDRGRGVEVSAEQGLLVVELAGDDATTQVHLNGRLLGGTPVAVAVSEGRHELMFRRADDTKFRYLVIRRGETRVVQAP